MSRQVAILGERAQGLYQRILYVVVQSGAMYCSLVIVQLFCYGAGVVSGVPVHLFRGHL